jgi:hypothetical protein
MIWNLQVIGPINKTRENLVALSPLRLLNLHKYAFTFNSQVPRGKLPLTIEDHVWFEDRWMVASLCDE